MNTVTMNKIQFKDVPQGRLGMWILIAGELVIFGGLIASYVLYRMRFPEWAEQAAHTSTPMGALNTFILLFSSYAVVRAHMASVKKEIGDITKWISVTLVCGLGFLVVKTIEYATEISHGFTLPGRALLEKGDNIGATFWSFYYLMTGLHALHVIVGMIILFAALLQARKGKNLHRIEMGGLYWHMVDLIWIFLFPLLYIAS